MFVINSVVSDFEWKRKEDFDGGGAVGRLTFFVTICILSWSGKFLSGKIHENLKTALWFFFYYTPLSFCFFVG